jgi:hypothetical protein
MFQWKIILFFQFSFATEKEKKLRIDSENQQQGVTDEYTKPFDRTKQDKNKTSFTRQLSRVAYGHTCSGKCNRYSFLIR